MRLDRCMSTPWRFGALSLGFSLLLFAGCRKAPPPVSGPAPVQAPSKANNLRYVDCNKHIQHNPSPIPPVVIAVDPDTGLDPQDEVIFVCTGEPVIWKVRAGAESRVRSFKIEFQNQVWPFSGTPVTLQGSGQTPTAEKVDAGLTLDHHLKPYKYLIEVTRRDNTKITFDPVYIPMGP